MDHRVSLRQVVEQDVAAFFAHQLEFAAVPQDQTTFSARWRAIHQAPPPWMGSRLDRVAPTR
jgi:hypothetical protein